MLNLRYQRTTMLIDYSALNIQMAKALLRTSAMAEWS
jgi:hypothetical protein